MDIINVVVSGSLNQPVFFDKLLLLGDKVLFPKSKYPAIYLVLNKGKVTIYKNGKYVIKGIPSIENIPSSWKEMKDTLSSCLDSSLFEYPHINNIVGMGNCNKSIQLNDLFIALKNEKIEYEPELFPGFIWKTRYGTANIFSSGKVILLGCKTIEELNIFWDYIYNNIINY